MSHVAANTQPQKENAAMAMTVYTDATPPNAIDHPDAVEAEIKEDHLVLSDVNGKQVAMYARTYWSSVVTSRTEEPS